MNIKIIPIVQLILIAAAMLGIQKLSPSLNYHGNGNLPLFTILCLTGFGLIMAGSKEFLSYKTTTNPINIENTTQLVTSGLYKYSRNPMYIGLVLSLLGWAALIGSVLSLIALPLFIWSMTQYQIRFEEDLLERKFGKDFIDYKKKVPRWL